MSDFSSVLGAPTWSDNATITASAERTGYPATNLLTFDPSDRWEAVPSTILSLNLDRGEVDEATLFGLCHHNGTAYGAWRLRLANNSAAEIDTDPVYDSSAIGDGIHGLGSYVQVFGNNAGTALSTGHTGADFTLEAMIDPAHGGAHGIVQRGASGTVVVIRVALDGTIEATDYPAESTVLQSTTKTSANTLIHVALNYDSASTTAQLIINGVLEDENTSVSSPWGNTSEDIVFSPTQIEPFTGKGYYVRFWDFARSAAVILADKDQLLDGTESGLVAAWQFGEGSGSSAADVLGGSSMSFSATPYWGYPTPLWATTDQTPLVWKTGFIHIPEGVSFEFAQVDIIDSALSGVPFRMGRLVFANAVQLKNAPISGSDLNRWVDFSSLERSDLGVVSIVAQTPKRDLRIRFQTDDLEEATNLDEIMATQGISKGVMVVRSPTATTRTEQSCFYGRLKSEFVMTHQSYGDIRGQIAVEEL